MEARVCSVPLVRMRPVSVWGRVCRVRRAGTAPMCRGRRGALSVPLVRLAVQVGSQVVRAAADAAEAALRLMTGCSIVVGMHPDQAAGPIVDMAIALDKPFGESR